MEKQYFISQKVFLTKQPDFRPEFPSHSNKWSSLRQEPEAPINNATSRGPRREPPAGAGGLQVAGFDDLTRRL